MDDCPISFGPRAVLPLNPGFFSGSFSVDPPNLDVSLVFDTVMNQTSLPTDTSWAFEVDSTLTPVVSQSWLDSITLEVVIGPTAAPTVDGTVELLVEDVGLHSLSGMRNVLPFGPEFWLPPP